MIPFTKASITDVEKKLIGQALINNKNQYIIIEVYIKKLYISILFNK